MSAAITTPSYAPAEEHQGNIWHGLAWGCAGGALFYALVALAIAASYHA
jgi:hypothetical protein